MDAKALKKLAAACRAAGITYFKNAECEFSLGQVPEKIKNPKAREALEVPQGPIESDDLTEEQLLFYSVADIDGEDTEQ